MGEWFSYEIKFANKNESLVEALIRKGFATHTDRENVLLLDLLKLNHDMFVTGARSDGTYNISIEVNENGVRYYNKWSPDDRLCEAVSKCFPDDVFDCSRTYSASNKLAANWYEKNGNFTLKNGTPLMASIFCFNPNLIRDKEQNYQISLPIGDDTDKWGKIYVPKENVKYTVGTITGVKYNYSVLFGEETITVYFKNKKVRMSAKELVEKYYEAKDNYREDMYTEIDIEDLPRENFLERGSRQTGNVYYVVRIPCPRDVSANGFLSITACEFEVNTESGMVRLGPKGRTKSAYIIDEEGNKCQKNFPVPFIEKCYKESQKEKAHQETINDIEEPELD